MPHLIIETYGETSESVANVLMLVASTGKFELRVLQKAEVESLDYKPSLLPLTNALHDFSTGKLASVMVRPEKGFLYSSVNEPHFCGDSVPYWTNETELNGRNFVRLISISELRLVSVSLDEGLELTIGELELDNFPWDKSNLVIAAIKAGDTWRVGVGRSLTLLSEKLLITVPDISE